jgi:isoamylase
MQRHGIEPGNAARLGATPNEAGTNFALFSAHAERVELCLFDGEGGHEIARLTLPQRTGDVWHGYVPAIAPGQRYGYRAYGPYEPRNGHRFNPHKLLIDPYARELDRPFVLDDRHFGYRLGDPDGDLSFDERDSAPVMPKCIVTREPDEVPPLQPSIPWQDTILYELHVRGFTMLRGDIPVERRGTFAALGSPPVLAHVRKLGVTTIELMPIHPIGDEPHLKRLGLRNYWGYNPINFFAIEPRYATGDARGEFRALVDVLHSEGFELILDVVFNHTAEGDAFGPTLSLRGIDNASYYMLMPGEPHLYVNYTGVGNTLNVERRHVRDLVLDALRHWARLGVDGFRFDLASALARVHLECSPETGLIAEIAADPVLSKLKLIAEPWDASPDGYRLGAFPPPWREWNDRFRDGVRRFWRGDRGRAGEYASRISGSSDIFAAKGPLASINFVTAHDGFTLRDVVSYAQKHNLANGEKNADGAGENYSKNWGIDGPTSNKAVLALRNRHRRNLVATLLLSQGVPMLLAGDEVGHSQNGNNNAYCQDNETSWIDWRNLDKDAAFLRFVQHLIDLRKHHPEFRRETFFSGRPARNGQKDIVWLRLNGTEMQVADWSDPGLTAFACVLGERERLLCLFNPSAEDQAFIPPFDPGRWECIVDTSAPDIEHDAGTVAAHSMIVLKRAHS